MLHGTSADTGEEEYRIPKSIRFSKNTFAENSSGNSFETGNLKRVSRKGNGRNWTWSCWIKRAEWDASYGQQLFSVYDDTNNKIYFEIGYLQQIFIYNKKGGTATIQWKAEAKHRDPTAWFHIVIACDTNHDIETERLVFFLNGKRTGLNGHGNYAMTQYTEWMYNNDKSNHCIGEYGQNDDNSYSGLLSDVQWIDGLTLHAGAFGKVDSSGCWNPKTLKRPTPNDGTTWSNTAYWSCGEQGSYPFDNGFNGDTGTIAELDNSGTTGWVTQTFTPPNPIPVSSEVRIHGTGTSVHYSINGGKKYKGTSTGKWQTVFQGGGEITTVDFFADTNAPAFRAIEVDGVILLDGVTDSGEGVINNVNNGDGWSDGNTSYMDASAGGFPTNPGNSFDGSLGTWGGSFTGHGSQFRFKPDRPIVWNDKIEVWMRGQNDANAAIAAKYNNAGDWITCTKSKWSIVKEGGGTMTQLNGKNSDSTTQGIQLHAIRVDGHILINQGFNNSFHLKFDDTTNARNLGYSQVMNEPTGAQPMYGPGASDSAKSSLVLAIPGFDRKDHSATIKGSGSNKTLTFTGNATESITSKSLLYGTSLYCDGSGDKISAPSNTDFATGTDAFTYELWFWWDDQNANATLGATRGSGDDANGWSIDIIDGDDKIQMWTNSANNATPNNSVIKERWNHFACVRDDSNTMKFYINGIEKSSATVNNDFTTSGNGFTIGNLAGSNNFKGYYQDVRFYKGVAKYTANFIPPARHDFVVNDINPGSSNQKFVFTGITTASHIDNIRRGISEMDNSTLYSHLESDGSIKSGHTSHYGSYDSDHTVTFDPHITTESEFSAYGGAYSNPAAPWTITVTYADDSTASVSGTTTPWLHRCSFATGGKSVKSVRVQGTGANSQWASLSGFTKENSNHVITEFYTEDSDCSNDTPTPYGSDGGAGGQFRSNFCTWNQVDAGDATYVRNGNLDHINTGSNWRGVRGTMGLPSGKWYWECRQKATDGCSYGIASIDTKVTDHVGGGGGIQKAYTWGGANYYVNGTGAATGLAAMAHNDVIGVAFDSTNGKIHFRRNGQWYGHDGSTYVTATDAQVAAGTNPFSSGISTSIEYFIAHSSYGDGNGCTLNTGARPFNYAAPSGFKCVCTSNLDDTFTGDDKNNPSNFFNAIAYDGNANTNKVTGFNFSPEFVWIKNRITAYSHRVFDKNRGVLKIWSPDDEGYGETSVADTLTSFDTNGFTLGDGDSWGVNANKTYISWCWDASTVTSISAGDSDYGSPDLASTNYTNATAGIDIVKFTSTSGGDKSIAHRLGTVPDLVILKELPDNSNYHVCLHNAEPYDASHPLINETYYRLESTAAKNGGDNIYGAENGYTNALFSVGAGGNFNANVEVIAYLFAEIPGYSKFGKYEGNGDANGAYVHCGFKPRFLITKSADNTREWSMWDTERIQTNPQGAQLYLHNNSVEQSNSERFDILANGFKLRSTAGFVNENNETFIYIAFAEHPFKTARAL